MLEWIRPGKARAWFDRLGRMFRYRLFIPLLRSKHPPEYTARGVAVGLAWALTPTIGIQMPLVIATWIICRKVFRWDFNVVVGAAWTWTTNVVTMAPCYYAFYVTGELMLGRWQGLPGFETFQPLLDPLREDLSLTEFVRIMFDVVIKDWGFAMVVGSLPYAALGGWLGYVLGLRFVLRYREFKRRRRGRIRAQSQSV